jgi:TRAP-type mannitol/chloroaromatic compound transport system permease large subunit
LLQTPRDWDIDEAIKDYEELAEIANYKKIPLIATNRSTDYLGKFSGSETERQQILLNAARNGFEYVDIELSTPKLKETVLALLPAVFLIFLVMGTIFTGVCTPTEASALGALGSFILAIVYQKLTRNLVKECTMSAVKTTTLALIIVTGSMAFSQLLYGGCLGFVFGGEEHDEVF